MSNKEAAKILKKSLDACTKAIEQALKEKNYKAVEKSMRTAFAFMKGHRALKSRFHKSQLSDQVRDVTVLFVEASSMNALIPIVQIVDSELTGRNDKCLLQK